MTDFDSLADEDWQILVEEYELNEPTVYYPDPNEGGAFVGPLVKIFVGATTRGNDGEETLELNSADGRNLAAVACLPQFAELFRWVRQGMAKLNAVHFDSQTEYGLFIRELRDRIDWIASCIDDRDERMGIGMHGFARFPTQRTSAVDLPRSH